MSTLDLEPAGIHPPADATALVLPFSALDRGALAVAGGKAANLGELTRAGFPVPSGFCITTAGYSLAAAGANLESALVALAATPAEEPDRLAELAGAARDRLLAAPIPAAVAAAIVDAYQALGVNVPVAVRSSATAEDLPQASFAGQQDTYLNVVGTDAVLDAVRRCWASLWTDRAVSYRARNRVDHSAVRLAVVVQQMVAPVISGVLFTANPVTGRRRQAVVDANPGLGEAIVSGAVNPDHFVVDTASGSVVERRLGDKRLVIRPVAGGGTERRESIGRSDEACIADDQLRTLAALGARIEAHYGAPQDVEFAIDENQRIWIVQSRPITTLFPLPAAAPPDPADLRIYFSFNVAQGVFRPFTPMGCQVFRLMTSAAAIRMGRPPRDRFAGPGVFVEAADRLFIDLTPILCNPLGRRLLDRAGDRMEARTAAILQQGLATWNLPLTPIPRWRTALTLATIFMRLGFPMGALRAILSPKAARAKVAADAAALYALSVVPASAGAAARLAAVERLFLSGTVRVGVALIPVFGCGIAAHALASRLLQGLASEDELQAVLRGLPHNPTTEMNLELWALAERLRADPGAAQVVRTTPPEQLALAYHAGTLSPMLQQGLAAFLKVYGHRGVAEIDIGLPRWAEAPTHVLGMLANYLQLENPDLAADVQFRRAADEGEAMVAELTRRAAHRGRLRGVVVGFCLGRTRALAGLREGPKFYFVKAMALGRELLRPVGEQLARSGRLETEDDIFFVTIPEARAGLDGRDLRPLVRDRRASYQLELQRRHIPRILLSDGTEPAAEPTSAVSDQAQLRGSPASAGTVTAHARVILDPTGAHLEPGEILVAPSTDPGWTPLFLTAAGLVMEMGGAMSHGAVVAREYGIPAVVGVPDATQRILTGQRITVDGSAGTIAIEPEGDA